MSKAGARHRLPILLLTENTEKSFAVKVDDGLTVHRPDLNPSDVRRFARSRKRRTRDRVQPAGPLVGPQHRTLLVGRGLPNSSIYVG